MLPARRLRSHVAFAENDLPIALDAEHHLRVAVPMDPRALSRRDTQPLKREAGW